MPTEKTRPSIGPEDRLNQLRAATGLAYDRRNFDWRMCNLLETYVQPRWREEFKRTVKYLRNLKSSKDGKYFSQGVKDPQVFRQQALNFAKPNHRYFGYNRFYKAAKEKLIKEFSQFRLDPLVYQCDSDMVDILPKKDAHAGYTYCLTGYKYKGDNLDNVFKVWKETSTEALKNGTFNRPIIPAVRTQGKGKAFDSEGKFTYDCDHKTRLVSIIDMMVIFTELIFAKPIQDVLAKTSWYAGGKAWDADLQPLIRMRTATSQYWTTLDYSGYDQSISDWLIWDAFEIIHSAFNPLTVEQEDYFSLIRHDLIHKKIIMFDGDVTSHKGVPSGSMFTQILDSIINILMITTYFNFLESTTKEKTDYNMLIMGDDNLIFTNRSLDRHHLASYLNHNFGVSVNPDKTSYGRCYDEFPEFLSCVWRVNDRWREPHELIAKLLYPERKRNYEDGRTRAELVLLGYFMCYRGGMNEFMNTSKFYDDFKFYRFKLEDIGEENLPGALAFQLRDRHSIWAGLTGVV